MIAMHTWITRAMHEDGLCDCIDAFSAYTSIEERLRIMKDPQIGSFASVFLFFVVMFRFVSLVTAMHNEQGSIDAAFNIVLIWILGGVIAKTMIVFTAYRLYPAKEGGLGELMKNIDGYVFIKTITMMSICILGAIFFVENAIMLFLALVICFIVAYYYIQLTYKKIGGFTGDVFGAVEQISFTLFITIALMAM